MLVITEEIRKTYVKAKLIFKSKQLSSGMAEPQMGGVQLCAHIFDKWYFLSAFYRDLNFENRTISG